MTSYEGINSGCSLLTASNADSKAFTVRSMSASLWTADTMPAMLDIKSTPRFAAPAACHG